MEPGAMNESTSMILKSIDVLFLVLWGAYERISAIQKEKKHAGLKDRDKNSLILFYITILLGYFVGVPLAFTPYGKITLFFPYLHIIGFIITAAGLAIRLTAIKTLDKHFTYTVKIIDNHELITSGIYSRVSHPAYSGQALIFLGTGIAFSNWLSLLLLFVPNFIAALYRIAVEEKVLSDHFSDKYKEYSKKTKLLIPWVC